MPPPPPLRRCTEEEEEEAAQEWVEGSGRRLRETRLAPESVRKILANRIYVNIFSECGPSVYEVVCLWDVWPTTNTKRKGEEGGREEGWGWWVGRREGGWGGGGGGVIKQSRCVRS